MSQSPKAHEQPQPNSVDHLPNVGTQITWSKIQQHPVSTLFAETNKGVKYEPLGTIRQIKCKS